MSIAPPVSLLKTRTGAFPVGFRQGFSDWQKELGPLLEWAGENQFGVVDVKADAQLSVDEIRARGFRVGSVDLPEWRGMISPDVGTRRESVAKNREFIEIAAKSGPLNFFVVMLPEKPEISRRENFGYMVESYGELVPTLEALDSHVVIEGWPGPGALCCTPEGCRAILREFTSGSVGINYDPSHLVRMGIDPVRFLKEFVSAVYHVHAKDALLLDEGLYEYGNLQPATFSEPCGFGEMCWRYTLPGFGIVPWDRILSILAGNAYTGAVCIELEDAAFNGTIEGEKEGLLLSGRFLSDS